MLPYLPSGDPLPRWRKIASLSLWTVPFWVSLLAGCLVSSIAGTVYMFGLYGPYLKSRLHYEQDEINNVAFAGNLGVYFCIIPGLFFDYFGPRPTCILSGLLMSLGWFGLWCATNFYASGSMYAVGIYVALAGIGSGSIYTAAVAPNLYNCSSKNRGKIAGLLASLFGLSSAIFSQIFELIFNPDYISFFLFLTITLGLVSLLGVFLINYIDHSKDEEKESLLKNEDGIKTSIIESNNSEYSTPDVNPLKLLIRIDFWLFIVAFTTGTGAGLMLVNNIGELWLSLGGKDGDQSLAVTIFSISNCGGRLIIGTISDIVSKYNVNRLVVLGFSILLMVIAQLVLSIVTLDTIYVGIVLAGFSYGGHWSLAPVITYELWGEKHFGVNFNMLGLAPALGSYLLGTVMASSIYQKHTINGSSYCYGKDCYQESFWICSAVCTFGASLAFILSQIIFNRKQISSKTVVYH